MQNHVDDNATGGNSGSINYQEGKSQGQDQVHGHGQGQDLLDTHNPIEADFDVIEARETEKRGKNPNRRRMLIAVLVICLIGIVVGIAVVVAGAGGGSGGGSTNDTQSDKNDAGGNDSPATSAPVDSGGNPSPSTPPATVEAPTSAAPASIADPNSAPPTSMPTNSNLPQYITIINSIARGGGAEFDEPDSYQSKARAWILQQDLPTSQSLSLEEEIAQLYALACLYYNTYAVSNAWTDKEYTTGNVIPGWISDNGWLGDPKQVCNWYGLTCTFVGLVQAIKLDRNGLTGFIPPELALLHPSLKIIDLFQNNVHNRGDIGNSFLGELVNLEELFYGSTYFEHSGGIPTELGNLKKLRELDFSYTFYDGPLNGDIFKDMTELKYLSIGGSSFNSTIPDEIVQLPKLEFFFAGLAGLKGDLEFIAKMPSIREIWIDNNPGFAGSLIPSTIGQAKSLTSFSAAGCGLEGPLPTEIGELRDMKQLWLYDNKLTGKIPTQIVMMFKIEKLQLEKNLLTGDMPAALCEKKARRTTFVELEADCDGEITCPETCCTCCGEVCVTKSEDD